MQRCRSALGLVLVALVATLFGACEKPPCYLDGTEGVEVFRWDGGGDGLHWSQAANWDRNRVPGELFPASYDDVVCIPAGANVRLGGGETAVLVALDSQGILTVGEPDLPLPADVAGALHLIGDPTTQISRATDLRLISSTLGGRGTIRITSQLISRNRQGAPLHTGRNPGATSGSGTTIIEPGATLRFIGDSTNAAGTNVDFGRIIRNRGTTTLEGTGYVTAATGVGVEFRNEGTFRILNDRGYYQGTHRGSALSTFRNSGTVWKSAGTGTSIIDASFEDAGGTLRVDAGRLAIYTDQASGTVAPGTTLSTGTCLGQGCSGEPVARPEDEEVVGVTLPPIPDAPPGVIEIVEGGDSCDATTCRPTVQITREGTTGTVASPVRITITLDAATWSGVPLSSVVVRRDGTVVPPCTDFTAATPNPCRTAGSITGGDLRIVVRATSQVDVTVDELYSVNGPRIRR